VSMSEIIKRAMRKFHLEVHSETIVTGERLFVSSGAEMAYYDLTINGVFRVDGKAICNSAFINNKLMVNGMFEVGYA